MLAVVGDLNNAAVNALNIDTDSDMSDVLDNDDAIQLNELKTEIANVRGELERANATVRTFTY